MYHIIYHKNCTDGLGAALAIRVWLKKRGELDQATFQTAQYGDPAPDDVAGQDVFIVDFSYPREDLLTMYYQAKNLTVIDHHVTAQETLADLDFCIFDMNKSGCILTWEYLFPNLPPPPLFEYLQDRDLWKWELPQSQEVNAALRSYKPFLDEWEAFMTYGAINRLKKEGIAILRYQQRQIEMVLSHKPWPMVEIDGTRVPCINSTTLISEIGNELSKEFPFAACYFDTNDGKRVFSLRSNPDGANVADIAKKYGGGGHPRAAGFSVEKPEVLKDKE